MMNTLFNFGRKSHYVRLQFESDLYPSHTITIYYVKKEKINKYLNKMLFPHLRYSNRKDKISEFQNRYLLAQQ